MKRLFLIDAHALIHRTYHALPPLTDKTGGPAGALYGMASILIKILREQKPDYIMAFFDRPEPTFREEVFRTYKIQRPKAADDLIVQLIEARKLFEAFGIKIFEAPGYEADDLIGAATSLFEKEPGLAITIFTGDRDLLQLVDKDRVLVEALRKGVSDTLIYNEKAVIDHYGILPKELPEYKGLVGDASDNIKGVSGIGPKTARRLIQKYHTLENFLETGQNEKQYALILEQKDEALLARDLCRLHSAAPLDIKTLGEAAYTKIPVGPAERYLEEKGFASLVRRLEEGPKEKNEKGWAPARGLPAKRRRERDRGTQSLFG